MRKNAGILALTMLLLAGLLTGCGRTPAEQSGSSIPPVQDTTAQTRQEPVQTDTADEETTGAAESQPQSETITTNQGTQISLSDLSYYTENADAFLL